MISVRFKNINKVIKAFNKAPKKLERGLKLAIGRTGEYSVGQVKRNITSGIEMWKPPIDTGAMRRGIQVSSQSMDGKTIKIRPSHATPYAEHVHEGTRYMKARPFFDITAKRDEDKVRKFFQRELDKTIRDIL